MHKQAAAKPMASSVFPITAGRPRRKAGRGGRKRLLRGKTPYMIIVFLVVGSVILVCHDLYPISGSVSELVPSSLSSPSIITVIESSADAHIRGGSYQAKNYGNSPIVEVKRTDNQSYLRRGLLEFDLIRAKETDFKAYLNIYIEDVGSQSSRTVTLKKLAPTNWKENEVTFDNFLPIVDEVGTSFEVRKSDQYSWIRIDISDLIDDESNSLLLMLEVTSEANTQSHFKFRSREWPGFAPFIIFQRVLNIL